MSRRLDEIVRTDPHTKSVALDYQGLTDLTPLVSVLGVLPNVTRLDLRGNRLQSLPNDLSSMRALRVLDISQNSFRTSSDVLRGLASLPNLEELFIDFSSPEEEENVLMALPRLRALNGARLDEEDDLPQPPPRPAPQPQPQQSGKPSLVKSVAAAPVAAVPMGFNDHEFQGRGSPGSPSHEVSLTEEDLENVALLYGAINTLSGKPTPEADAALSREFEDHIQRVMKQLAGRLSGVEDPFLRQSEILMAKHELYDICFQKVIDNAASNSKQFGAVLRKLRAVHKTLFSQFPDVLADMKPFYSRQVEDLSGQLSAAHQETTQLLEAAELLEQEAAARGAEKERLTTAFERERQRLLHANKKLEDEAQAMSQQLKAFQTGGAKPKASLLDGSASVAGESVTSGMRNAAGAKAASAPPAAGSAAGGAAAGAEAGTAAGSVAGAPGTVRTLSLKQLKEIIEAIYASKVKFDEKCAEAHLPRETMEQHMYTYLNQRYGLRSLIIEYASAIHRAVKKFRAEDNEVAVFGLILANEIDEEFRYVQKQLRETVVDLLRVYLKGKYRMKPDDAINELLSKRLAGKVYEEEVVDVVKYMYNEDDSLVLIVKINEVAAAEAAAKPVATDLRGKSRDARAEEEEGKITFVAFLKVLLDFQLQGHQSFLARFREMFVQSSEANHDVVNEAQFKELVQRVDPSKTDADITALLHVVDPYNNQHITFSECVTVLSADIVNMMSR